MPVKRTTSGGKPAYKWGDSGKPFTYEAGNAQSRGQAKAAAERQGRAIRANQTRQANRRAGR
jgi:hypothetical protein